MSGTSKTTPILNRNLPTITSPQNDLIMVLMNKLKPRYLTSLYFIWMHLKTLSHNWLCKIIFIVPSRRITWKSNWWPTSYPVHSIAILTLTHLDYWWHASNQQPINLFKKIRNQENSTAESLISVYINKKINKSLWKKRYGQFSNPQNYVWIQWLPLASEC